MRARIALALGALLCACLCAIGGFFYGVATGKAGEQAARQQLADVHAHQVASLQQRIDSQARQAQAAEYARQHNVRTIYHESQKIIERPLYRAICIDADGVGLLDRAAATANGAGAGKPVGVAGAAAIGAAD